MIKTILCFVVALFSALSFSLGQEGYIGISDLPPSSTSLLWTSLALLFALGFHYVYIKKCIKPSVMTVCFGVLFGFLNALMSHLFAYDQWDALLSPLPAMIMTARALCQALPMIAFLSYIDNVLKSGSLSGVSKFPAWVEKRSFSLIFSLLIICWLPYVIIFYPGTVNWDLGEMAAQFFGQRSMDTWHPVFTTWIFGSCIWIGRLVGSDNIGALLFTLLQLFALAFACTKTLQYLKEKKAHPMFFYGTLAFYALCPLFGGYVQFISKDTLYTAFMLLFGLECVELLQAKELNKKEIIVSSIKLFIYATLTCLLRSNGLYVILPTAIVLCIFGLRHKLRIACSLSLALALSVVMLFNNVLIPSLGIVDATTSGIYSACFQQSARVLRDHVDEVSETQFEEIDRVLDAEKLGELYEPWISDPVKFTFRYFGKGAEIEKEVLTRYRSTWLEMMKQFPLDYAESFFAGNMSYYTFQPKINEERTYNYQAGNRLVFETYSLGDDPRLVHTKQPQALETPRILTAMYARGWRHLPILSLLYTCAMYTWLLVGCAISLCHQRRFKLLIAFMPALFTLAVCMLSPVNDYFRYFLPITALTPLLLGLSNARK